MKHRHAISIFSALVMAISLAIPAEAAGPITVGVLLCNNNGGSANVPAASVVTFWYGWGSKTQRQANQFVNRASVRFTVRGTAIANPNSYWGTPVQVEGGDWVVSWRYPFGKLGTGNTARITMQLTLTRSVSDGYSTYPAGPIHSPALKCKIY